MKKSGFSLITLILLVLTAGVFLWANIYNTQYLRTEFRNGRKRIIIQGPGWPFSEEVIFIKGTPDSIIKDVRQNFIFFYGHMYLNIVVFVFTLIFIGFAVEWCGMCRGRNGPDVAAQPMTASAWMCGR